MIKITVIMKIYIGLFLITTIQAASIKENDAKILKQRVINDGSGYYMYSFATSDGIEKEETGFFTDAENSEDSFSGVRGSFTYIGPDNIKYQVKYLADKNGFQPEGNHLHATHDHRAVNSASENDDSSPIGPNTIFGDKISNADGYRKVNIDSVNSGKLEFKQKKKN